MFVIYIYNSAQSLQWELRLTNHANTKVDKGTTMKKLNSSDLFYTYLVSDTPFFPLPSVGHIMNKVKNMQKFLKEIDLIKNSTRDGNH